jgi:hypothetical protein
MRVLMTAFDGAGFGRLATARELLDDPVDSLDELEGSLRDIAFANTWFGGTSPVACELDRVRAARACAAGRAPSRPVVDRVLGS